MKDYKKVFESENINYVNINEELIDDYLTMVNDVNVQKGISRDVKTYTYLDELNWVETKLKNNEVIFSMIEKNTNEFIGNVEVRNIKNGIGEIGISITPLKQNKHYGLETIKKIVEYAFNELKLNNVYLNVHKDNLRAIQCYKNAGFIITDDGKTSDDYYMIYKK